MMGFEASSPIVVCRVGHLHDMKDLLAGNKRVEFLTGDVGMRMGGFFAAALPPVLCQYCRLDASSFP
jgi:hypothetical protein